MNNRLRGGAEKVTLNEALQVVSDLGRALREQRFAFYRKLIENPHEPPIWLDALPHAADLRTYPRDAVAFACGPKSKGFPLLGEFTQLEALFVLTLSDERMKLLAPLSRLQQLMLQWATFTSFEPLAGLRTLQALVIKGNLKITSLATLTAVSQIRTLLLHDLRRLPRLDGIEGLTALTGLVIECGCVGGMRTDMTVDSLRPLSALRNLKLLRLENIHVRDQDLSPLVDLAPGTTVSISAHCYPLDQLARVAAKHPNCHEVWRQPRPVPLLRCKRCASPQVFVIGRENGRMCPVCHADRIQAVQETFEALVARYA